MIEIIDDMFFWNAEGSFIKDFNRECINTLDFLNSILQFEFNPNLEKQKGYSRELGEIETLKYHLVNKSNLLNKQKWSNGDNSRFRINFFKAVNNPHQKKLE